MKLNTAKTLFISIISSVVKLRHDLPILEHPDVYPPSEDTHLMIRAISVSSGERVLEIGPGSGIVSIHCALEGCAVTAIDVNPEAVRVTEKNAERCGVSERINAIHGDLFSPLGPEKFDVIIFNPPYLVSDSNRKETDKIELAWEGGTRGKDTTERFLSEAKGHLKRGGRIYLLLERQNRTEELIARFSEFYWEEVAKADFFFEHLTVYVLTMAESDS